LIFGVWSLLFSRSFDTFIDFPPYNEHLLHDVGAVQIGIGVSVLLALMWSDSIGVALVAFIVAGTIHSINHALDRHLGATLPINGGSPAWRWCSASVWNGSMNALGRPSGDSSLFAGWLKA
jgi:hypothetical protein